MKESVSRLEPHVLAAHVDVVRRLARAVVSDRSVAEDVAQDALLEALERPPAHQRDLRAWFRALYEILLGQSQGPRMGSFIALYGLAETITLIERALAGEDLSAA